MKYPESVYQIQCVCGVLVESHSQQTVCEKCGRVLVVEGWGKS